MRYLTGVVIAKNIKSATVAVSNVSEHPIYKKRIRKTKKYHVHDDVGVAVGSTVRFRDSKPYSKTIRWKIDMKT